MRIWRCEMLGCVFLLCVLMILGSSETKQIFWPFECSSVEVFNVIRVPDICDLSFRLEVHGAGGNCRRLGMKEIGV